jgi:branched-chain amino acid transport system permease protein
MNRRAWKITGILGVLVLLSLPLFFESNYYYHLAILIYFNIILCCGLYVIMSTGLLSIAQAAFMGIGAYTSALLVLRAGVPFVVGVLAAGLTATLLSLVIGYIVLRLKGVYFVLVTFALNEFIRLVFSNWVSLFGGVSGLTNIPPPRFTLPWAGLSLVLDSKRSFYCFLTVITGLVVIVVARVMKSEFGRAFKSVRDSELLAESTGVNTAYYRILAFCIAAFFAGIGGSLYAHYLGYISPQYFSFMNSFDFVVFTVVGGLGYLIGPILGCIVLTPIPEFLRGLKELHLVLYGMVLIGFMLFAPQGLVSFAEGIGEKLGIRNKGAG